MTKIRSFFEIVLIVHHSSNKLNKLHSWSQFLYAFQESKLLTLWIKLSINLISN